MYLEDLFILIQDQTIKLFTTVVVVVELVWSDDMIVESSFKIFEIFTKYYLIYNY